MSNHGAVEGDISAFWIEGEHVEDDLPQYLAVKDSFRFGAWEIADLPESDPGTLDGTEQKAMWSPLYEVKNPGRCTGGFRRYVDGIWKCTRSIEIGVWKQRMLCIWLGWKWRGDRQPWVVKVNRGHHPLGTSGGFPRSRRVPERQGYRQGQHSRGSEARLGGDDRAVETSTAGCCLRGVRGQQRDRSDSSLMYGAELVDAASGVNGVVGNRRGEGVVDIHLKPAVRDSTTVGGGPVGGVISKAVRR